MEAEHLFKELRGLKGTGRILEAQEILNVYHQFMRAKWEIDMPIPLELEKYVMEMVSEA